MTLICKHTVEPPSHTGEQELAVAIATALGVPRYRGIEGFIAA
jgi:hypothetical protein